MRFWSHCPTGFYDPGLPMHVAALMHSVRDSPSPPFLFPDDRLHGFSTPIALLSSFEAVRSLRSLQTIDVCVTVARGLFSFLVRESSIKLAPASPPLASSPPRFWHFFFLLPDLIPQHPSRGCSEGVLDLAFPLLSDVGFFGFCFARMSPLYPTETSLVPDDYFLPLCSSSRSLVSRCPETH